MDVLNKLRSTVSSTVSSLSSALPGNPVTREFEATSHICSAGPGLLWKVYAGYKNSTKQEASIFVFEKKNLEKWPRESRDAIVESLKRGVAQVTRLRHPQVLTIQHPLEESRDSLAFATEPVFASLANVLGNHENMPSTLPPAFRDHKLFELEKKYGLLQIAEGLAFLHNDVKLLHSNICPESIVINQQGAWKIFGFDFCIHNESSSWKCNEYTAYVAHVAQPSLDYMAPEAALANSRTPSSDMFSLGALVHAIYMDGMPPVSSNNDLSSYKMRVNELKHLPPGKLNKIPDGLRDITRMLLNYTPELRPDAHQFKRIDFFEDVGVKTLNYLDALFQWDKLQKSQFYKGLPSVIQHFPHRVNLYRVVPCLGKEFTNSTMVPFVLPVVLQIAEKSTKEEYLTHIFPFLRTAMKLTEPVQVLLIFMQQMELLLKITPAEEIKSDVLPMLKGALDSDAQEIQELCLSVLPTYATLIDYPIMKNTLLPRIKKLCISTGRLSVRVNCLVCIGKLLEHLDKWLVLDEVLPFLQQIPSREPAVLMAILGIFKITLTHKKLGIPKEMIAAKVIPFLMPMTIENGLTLTQFNTLFAVLRDMINRVESEHRTKLEQLSAIDNETNTLSNVTSLQAQVSPSSKVDLDALFSGVESISLDKTTENGLTMSEKQRIMREKEAVDRFGSNMNTMRPTPVATNVQQPPRDLTSTLINSNLANLSFASKPSPQPSLPSMNSHNLASSQPFGTPSLGTHYNLGASDPIQNLNWSTPTNTSAIPNRPALMISQPVVRMPPPVLNLSMAHPIQPGRSVQARQPAGGSGGGGNPLTSSEINDLLS